LHTAVDTCGLAQTRQVIEIAPLTDLFLFDLKVMDDARHTQFTGASNVPILDNLQALSRVHDRIWLRVPVIPGLNDAAADLEATARFAGSLRGIRQVNLLPYHPNGGQKLRRLGREPALLGASPPSAAALAAAADIFQRQGLITRIGG
jgi:pyruvate formate lyase activating enzyme